MSAPREEDGWPNLGSSSIQMTFDRYGYLMPGNEDEAAELLNAHLQRSRRTATSEES